MKTSENLSNKTSILNEYSCESMMAVILNLQSSFYHHQHSIFLPKHTVGFHLAQ